MSSDSPRRKGRTHLAENPRSRDVADSETKRPVPSNRTTELNVEEDQVERRLGDVGAAHPSQSLDGGRKGGYTLERCERIAEPCDVGRDELVRAFDPPVESDDLVEVVLGTEVEVVNVAREAGTERDGELLLEVADLLPARVSGGEKGLRAKNVPCCSCRRWEQRERTST